MNVSKLLAVHGTTGSQGSAVAAELTAAGHDLRPVARAAGTDLLDRAALERAYAGVDAVVAQLPLVYDERALAMAENVARAAEAAGVPHLVLNTGAPLPPEPIGVPYLDARHVIAGAAVERITVLQPTRYLENLSAPWSAGRVVRDGVLAYPVPGDVAGPWVAASDLGRAAAAAIADGTAGTYLVSGPVLAGDELAAQLGTALGRPVRWEHITPDAFADLLRPHVGDHAADGTAAVYRMTAAMPPSPLPDPEPARAAFGLAPLDVAAWARSVDWPSADRVAA